MSQAVTPYVLYADAEAALDFLTRAFGFEEVDRQRGSEGDVTHAEMRIGAGRIYLGNPGPGYRNPLELGADSVLVCVDVEDVDSHCDRARQAGAEIRSEPEAQPYGERRYEAADPEGHRWFFSQPAPGRGV
ncbi:MAG TPA: VOC family protein [Gaiellales bacterium]